MDSRHFSSDSDEAPSSRKSIFDRIFYISAFFILTFVPPMLDRNFSQSPLGETAIAEQSATGAASHREIEHFIDATDASHSAPLHEIAFSQPAAASPAGEMQ